MAGKGGGGACEYLEISSYMVDFLLVQMVTGECCHYLSIDYDNMLIPE